MAAIIITGVTLIFTMPFIARIKISYDEFRRYFFVKIYFISIRVITIKILITDKIYFSLGKKAKELKLFRLNRRHANKMRKLAKSPFFVTGNFLFAYGREEQADVTAKICGSVSAFFNIFQELLINNVVNLRANVVPIFNASVFTLRINLTVIAAPLKILFWLL